MRDGRTRKRKIVQRGSSFSTRFELAHLIDITLDICHRRIYQCDFVLVAEAHDLVTEIMRHVVSDWQDIIIVATQGLVLVFAVRALDGGARETELGQK
jgi:hypothetical protein